MPIDTLRSVDPEERAIANMRAQAERLWCLHQSKEARKALTQSLRKAFYSPVLPEKVREHLADIATLVFRKRKEPMPLRDLSVPHVSKPRAQPQPPARRPGSGLTL